MNNIGRVLITPRGDAALPLELDAASVKDFYDKMPDSCDMDNVFLMTNSYLKMCELQKQVLKDVDCPFTLMRTYFFLVSGRKHNRKTNVTTLANFHRTSRATMMRKLKKWETQNKITLVKRDKETNVYGTPESFLLVCQYINKLAQYMTPINNKCTCGAVQNEPCSK